MEDEAGQLKLSSFLKERLEGPKNKQYYMIRASLHEPKRISVKPNSKFEQMMNSEAIRELASQSPDKLARRDA